MKSSAKRIHANQQNAQKSTGPTTVEGKTRSSQNARRHGITAQTTVMTEEDRLQHDAFCQEMMADLAPVGTVETFLASSVVEEAWRLNYARAACNNIVAIGHFDGTGERYSTDHAEVHTAITAASVMLDHAKDFELLSLYEQRIHRAFQKHFDQLKKLQAEREAKREADMEDAMLLSQLNDLKNLVYFPEEDGFVFSNEEIERSADRFHRLQQAKNTTLSSENTPATSVCPVRLK